MKATVMVEMTYREAEETALAIERRLTDGTPKEPDTGDALRHALLKIRDGQADTAVGRDRARGGVW